MSISSRTPEGFPNRCPICGAEFVLEPSQPTGDAPCPQCGHLLWWFREKFAGHRRLEAEQVIYDTLLHDLSDDSLDQVELIMELEEEFDIAFPDDEAEQVRTVADAIRLIEKHRRESAS
jgi:acyl carrier protein